MTKKIVAFMRKTKVPKYDSYRLEENPEIIKQQFIAIFSTVGEVFFKGE